MLVMPVSVPMHHGAPSDFLLKMRPLIATVVSIQAAVAICRLICMDVWGAVADVTVVVMGYFAAKDTEFMYVLYYGIGCGVNFIFDVLGVVLRLSRLKMGYFDLSLPFLFNLTSFALLAAAVSAFVGATIALAVYRDYRREAEAMPVWQQQQTGGYMPDPFLLPATGAGASANTRASTTSTSFKASQPFQGTGHRLGAEAVPAPSVDGLPPAPAPGARAPGATTPTRGWVPEPAPIFR
mmetsp:Transcript_34723/g.95730  ORF Transcript_34723/g.95730 Transcript_34723/m.95730 type:complete len:238 (-) Transcript_34723:187-900(-)